MKAVLAAPLIVAGLAIAGVAVAAPPAPDACFYTRDMGNHKIADDHTLYIHVRQHDIYRLTMRGGCLAGALSTDPIILRSPPGSTHICKPIDLDISIGRAGGGMATPCIVDSITKLTPGEAAALPKRARP